MSLSRMNDDLHFLSGQHNFMASSLRRPLLQNTIGEHSFHFFLEITNN